MQRTGRGCGYRISFSTRTGRVGVIFSRARAMRYIVQTLRGVGEFLRGSRFCQQDPSYSRTTKLGDLQRSCRVLHPGDRELQPYPYRRQHHQQASYQCMVRNASTSGIGHCIMLQSISVAKQTAMCLQDREKLKTTSSRYCLFCSSTAKQACLQPHPLR